MEGTTVSVLFLLFQVPLHLIEKVPNPPTPLQDLLSLFLVLLVLPFSKLEKRNLESFELRDLRLNSGVQVLIVQYQFIDALNVLLPIAIL